MKALPITTFQGYLKRISMEKLNDQEHALFDLLFPLFLPPSSATDSSDSRQKKGQEVAVRPQGLPVSDSESTYRPRRFAGYDFPGKRYFSVSMEPLGQVDQTLAHELRAYRNPRDVGYIDVLDLSASNVTLGIQTSQGIRDERINPDKAIAVIVHDFEQLPPVFQQMSIRTFEYGENDSLIGLFKFPYESVMTTIDDVIDLRLPCVQEWFFEFFSTIAEEHRQKLMAIPVLSPQSTIAYSRFHKEQGIPSPVRSFWGMLPTLLNPDVGGGNPASTGSTLTLIAQLLRQASVAAFIYPSARSDVSVTIENGALVDFEGWNLVDYREANLPLSKMEYLDCSPWCWQRLPYGVTIAVGQKSENLEGSFKIEGLVDYSARHYKQQSNAIKEIKIRTPELFDRGVIRKDAKPYFSWRLGGHLSRWLRRIITTFGESLKQEMMGVFGCAVLLDVYDIVGRIDDLASVEKDSEREWLNNAMSVSTRMGMDIISVLDRQCADKSLSAPFILGQALEQCLFYVQCIESWGPYSLDWSRNNLQGISSRMVKEMDSLAAIGTIHREMMQDFFVACEKKICIRTSKMGLEGLVKEGEEICASIANELKKVAQESRIG